MKNEKKRDVFDESVNELEDVLPDTVLFGNEYIADLVGELRARYAAALPDDLPVIPENVAYIIKQAKNGGYKLGWVFYATYLGLWRVSVGNWIRTHSDTFARAWLDGYVVEVDK